LASTLYVKPLQTVIPDEEFEGDSAQEVSDNFESTSSQPQSITQTSDSFVLDDLSNHYKGELPGYVPSSDKASKTASVFTVSENQQPETAQPFEYEFKLVSPSSKDQSVSNICISISEDIAYVVEPINVAKPANSLEAAIDSLPNIESTLEPAQPETQPSSSVMNLLN
jgi:hypothetical protein